MTDDTRYFFDKKSGDYLGAFNGPAAIEFLRTGKVFWREEAVSLDDIVEVDSPPAHGLDKLLPDGTFELYVEPIDVNKTLEAYFLGILPEHQGKPYLTGSVKRQIWQAKSAIAEAIKAGQIQDAVDIIDDLDLPNEMEAARTAIKSLVPQ